MKQQFKLADAENLMLSHDISSLDFADIIENISNDKLLGKFSPDGICQIDPRTGDLVVYNSSRAKRIHTTSDKNDKINLNLSCPICDGNSSEIFDLAKHSDGFTFVNKNIYPIFHPCAEPAVTDAEIFVHQDLEHNGRTSYGFHLLQWTSSIHEKDWHNILFDDALICFKQLAKLEKTLLCQTTDFMLRKRKDNGSNLKSGYVSIIKNYGAGAGASLTHGHQQIAYSNILPQRFYNNQCFQNRNNKSFSQFMIEENPNDLLVKDYGEVLLIVPYFMKRPFDLLLLVKDTNKKHLYELSDLQSAQLTMAIQDSIKSIIVLMSEMGLDPAYNMVINNGPGCGLYIEFFAKTQKIGGYEQIGLYVCQGNTKECAKKLKEKIGSFSYNSSIFKQDKIK